MTVGKDGAKMVGLAAAACVACCAGPIIGFLGAVGLGTVLGAFAFGIAGLAVGGVGGLWWLRRRGRQHKCVPAATRSVPVAAPRVRAGR
jgi:hypothetical protein